jgi:hypothetical protein
MMPCLRVSAFNWYAALVVLALGESIARVPLWCAVLIGAAYGIFVRIKR